MPRTELTAAMRVDGDLAQWVLLRTGAGERREPGLDAAVGRIAFGLSRLWEPAFDGALATGGLGGKPQACGQTAAGDGGAGGVPQALAERTGRRASDLSLPAGRPGNHRSGPGVVQRHHLCADGLRVHVFGG